MFADQLRALRSIRSSSLRSVWVAWLIERTADWIVILALFVAAAQSSVENAAAWILVAWVTPRVVLGVLYAEAGSRLGRLAWPGLTLVKAALTVVLVGGATAGLIRSVEIALGLTAVLGFLSALSADARHGALRVAVPLRELGQASATASLVDRAAALAGGIATTLMVLTLSSGTASPIPAILLFVLAAAFAFAAVRSIAPPGRGQKIEPSPDVPSEVARRIGVWIGAAFTGGAVGAALLVGAFALFSSQCLNYGPCDVITAASAGPSLVAAAALGMLLGPLPLPRVLVRISAELILVVLASVAFASTVAIIALRPSGPAVVSLPQLLGIGAAFLVFGFAAVNVDHLRSIAVQRLVPPANTARVKRLSLLAASAGQLFGALSVISLAGNDPLAVAAFLAAAQLFLLVLGLARAGRSAFKVGSLSLLPVKSVVHKLSWDTTPAAEPSDFALAEPRTRRLARWINRHAAVEKLRVRLPESGRQYDIYRPTEESREQLFEQGRADPDKQMPYWAKVWPSGVALADVVVERNGEVADKDVLELGAGLGVTACAILEHGGRLVTADYAALPLAHCRLNTLVNTGRAAHATCFNWRHDTEVTAALRNARFASGFPLIIAGDVLYEGRDAEPLLNVVERMLVEDGSLWLAEPVRRTAQRFLDSAAALGWEIASRQVSAEWPDATNGPVNLHFLRRSGEADRIVADLGGWRI